jgi:hypothetical protein
MIFRIKNKILRFIKQGFAIIDKPFISLSMLMYKLVVFLRSKSKEEYTASLNMRSWDNRDDFNTHVFLSRWIFFVIAFLIIYLVKR